MNIDLQRLDEAGFVLVEGFQSPAQVKMLSQWFPSLGGAAGTRSLLAHPEIAAFTESADVQSVVRMVLGATAPCIRAILFDKTADVNWTLGWHQDTKLPVAERVECDGWIRWSTKEGVIHAQPPVEYLENMIALRIAIDPADEHNGALQVLPGTHQGGLLTPVQVDHFAEAVTAVTCATEVGDLVLMRPLALHGSGKVAVGNVARRRVLHLEFCSLPLPEGLSWASFV